MTKSKTTKRALLSSCVALMLCFSMLLGTTYAWFTDSVTSANNIIKSGILDAEMYWNEDNGINWNDASTGAIYNYQYWEPGYTDAKYIMLKNVGNLAFKYQLNVIPGVDSPKPVFDLAEVIDVYCAIADENFEHPAGGSVEELTAAGLVRLGSLAELMANTSGADTGVLLPKEGNTDHIDLNAIADEYYEESVTVCLALHMQEEAGNEYQNLSVGEGFVVQLLATQYTYENDSFDNMYDENSKYPNLPKANVEKIVVAEQEMMDLVNGGRPVALDSAYMFTATEDATAAAESDYRYWKADFVVSFDNDVKTGTAGLFGTYSTYPWIGATAVDFDTTDGVDGIKAGQEIRLLKDVTQDAISINYAELCSLTADTGFKCGVVDYDGMNAGTTMTVELRLYETYSAEEAEEKFGDHSTNYETGECRSIKSISYTFGDKISTWDGVSTSEPEYDDATGAYMINNAAELAGFAKAVNVDGNKYSGKTVMLNADIDLNNKEWTPIGQTGATEFRGVFDGQGYTIYNLNINSSAQTGEHYSSGLFGWAESGVTIQNVKVDGATVVGNHNVAVIVGYTYSGKISNCHVTNAEIVCNHANDDACGDKCGLIAGYTADEARLTNCTGSNSTVTAGRDAGQLFGLAYTTSVSNCSADNVTVSATGDCNREGNINNAIIGRVMG